MLSSVISQNLKRSRNPERIPFGSNLSFMSAPVNLLVNVIVHTKFEMSSFTHSKDMIGLPLSFKMTTPLLA